MTREVVRAAVGSLVSLLENRDPYPDMDDPHGEFSRFAIYPRAYEDQEA